MEIRHRNLLGRREIDHRRHRAFTVGRAEQGNYRTATKSKAKAAVSYWISWGALAYDLVNDLADLTGGVARPWDGVNKLRTCCSRVEEAYNEKKSDFENAKEARAELTKLLT
jgi:hypothetical protein